MNIKTTRFGELEVKQKDIIKFQEGILGFKNLKKFFIVDPGDQTLILWLQSVDMPEMALPVLEPNIFNKEKGVKLLPNELKSLDLTSILEASIYMILTIPSDPTLMTANLKAPIIINNKTNLARQIVLQDNKLELKYNIYNDLKSYISLVVSDDSKRTNLSINNSNQNNNLDLNINDKQSNKEIPIKRRASNLSL